MNNGLLSNVPENPRQERQINLFGGTSKKLAWKSSSLSSSQSSPGPRKKKQKTEKKTGPPPGLTRPVTNRPARPNLDNCDISGFTPSGTSPAITLWIFVQVFDVFVAEKNAHFYTGPGIFLWWRLPFWTSHPTFRAAVISFDVFTLPHLKFFQRA